MIFQKIFSVSWFFKNAFPPKVSFALKKYPLLKVCYFSKMLFFKESIIFQKNAFSKNYLYFKNARNCIFRQSFFWKIHLLKVSCVFSKNDIFEKTSVIFLKMLYSKSLLPFLKMHSLEFSCFFQKMLFQRINYFQKEWVISQKCFISNNHLLFKKDFLKSQLFFPKLHF